MEFLGIPFDFIAEMADTYEPFLIFIPIIFILTQFMVYVNLNIIEKSYIVSWRDTLNHLYDTDDGVLWTVLFLTPPVFIVVWIGLVHSLQFRPGIISIFAYILLIMCVLPFLNLVSVRKINKHLFVQKLSN